jgi:hypothetical protein
METKQKLNTVNIKGKPYVLVSDRVAYFNKHFPNGSITTQLISEANAKEIVVKAVVIPDVKEQCRCFTGYSQAVKGEGYINQTSALENAETSAVGRALGFMGIGVIDSIASADEMVKADVPRGTKLASKKQLEFIANLCHSANIEGAEEVEATCQSVLKNPKFSLKKMTSDEASTIIDYLTTNAKQPLDGEISREELPA